MAAAIVNQFFLVEGYLYSLALSIVPVRNNSFYCFYKIQIMEYVFETDIILNELKKIMTFLYVFCKISNIKIVY